MNIFLAGLCRVYQQTFRVFSKLLSFRIPQVKEGYGSVSEIPEILNRFRKFHPLIVTTPELRQLNLDKKITQVLKDKKISYSIYSNVVPNPTFACVEDGYDSYIKENCDCLIAFGGGSAIDTTKAIGVKVLYPNKKLSSFKGVLKVRKKLPLLIAIPTTAGTGSEATAACVLVNQNTNDKFSINDPCLIPHFAILDDSFLENLPQSLISTTGMDALTHAIESYIGTAPSKLIKDTALQACALIKNNLYEFYKDNKNKTARSGMLKASYLAGVSFTRGYVGYVHALAHSLGGKYGIPHGYANAVLLPHVLEAYGKKAYKSLSEIADYLGFGSSSNSRKEKAEMIIDWIKDLNKKMGIPSKFSSVIKDEDLFDICSHASKEANPLYPVPKQLDENQLETILLLAYK